jgi:hypothetical protein
MNTGTAMQVSFLAGIYPNLNLLCRTGGNFLIGYIKPVNGAAVASDDTRVYAALVRREGESLEDLIKRLDEAVGQVMLGGASINELVDGEFVVGRKRRARGPRR